MLSKATQSICALTLHSARPVALISRNLGIPAGGERHNSQFIRPRNWHIAGLPPPQSLVHFGDVDLRERKREGFAQPLDPDPDHDAEHDSNADVDVKDRHARHARREPEKYERPRDRDRRLDEFRAHHRTMRKDFPQGWAPPRKLSREAMAGMRTLHAHNPDIFTTPVLANRFRISPEAVRRILKSSWEPTREERMRLLQREHRVRAAFVEKKKQEAREESRKKDRLALV